MTVKECIDAIETYYGTYERLMVRQFVVTELGQYSDAARAASFEALVRSHPSKWGPPDVAVIVQTERAYDIRRSSQPPRPALLAPTRTAEDEKAIARIFTAFWKRFGRPGAAHEARRRKEVAK